MSEYVPIEIQEEILKRLPLKPLIQFRSVSKSYKRLIDSSDFIVSYSLRHPQPDGCFILRYVDYPNGDKYKYIIDNDADGSFFQQEFIPTVPDLIKTRHNDIIYEPSVVGSSHGLLCFHIDCAFYEIVALWNPSLRKSVSIQVELVFGEKFATNEIIGFGVCPVTFDPTILKIRCINFGEKMKFMPDISIPWDVQVFTLSTGTSSFLSTGLPRESIRLSGSQVVIDRFIYWLAYDFMLDAEDGRSQSPFLIMSFDLTAKAFKEINLTGSLSNRLCTIQTISKLHESLVLLEYHSEFEEDISVCCLWMMKEQGVSRTFTKLYNINIPDAMVKTLLGFRKTGELILVTEQDGEKAKVEIYDPESEAIDNLEVHGDEFFMCSYMETLLLLDQLDGFMYSISNSSQMYDLGKRYG